jgi:thymidylate synthase (FAD)
VIIVQPEATLEFVTPGALEIIERAGRVCWKSEGRIGPGSAEKFIRGTIMKKQHFSVLEHAYATWRFIIDRGVSHEAVRHRIASFAQESTRYCNYADDNKFDAQIRVIRPPLENPESDPVWRQACLDAEKHYLRLIELGEKPQIARSVLPTCLKTELWISANFREWLHIFNLRVPTPPAHPQISEVMTIAQAKMQEIYPCVFLPMNEPIAKAA